MTKKSAAALQPAPPAVEFLDDPFAEEIFADDAAGFFLLNGNVRITFSSTMRPHYITRTRYPNSGCARCVARSGSSIAHNRLERFPEKYGLRPIQSRCRR